MNNRISKKVATAFFLVTLLFVVTLYKVQAQDIPPWTYQGDTGPAFWGQFSESCEVGMRQSPINIRTSKIENDDDDDNDDDDELQFNYKSTPLVVVNNGRKVEVEYEPGSTLKFNDTTFTLKEFHFHTPSEHTINGKTTPVEAHLVHEDTKGERAVVGVFINPGQARPILSSILANIPPEGQKQEVNGTEVNAKNLLPSKSSFSFYQYPGSLTTPGCDENVTWLIFKSPIQVSQAQIDQLTNVYPFSNVRPTQSLNDREVQLLNGDDDDNDDDDNDDEDD